jgi:hypothetical protein
MRVNTLRNVIYVALDFGTGLTDLTLVVRKPDGTLLSPIIMTEQGDGVYVASYTPDVIGVWQEKITSISNSDKVFRSTVVELLDLSDISTKEDLVKTVVDSNATKMDTLTSKSDAIKTVVDGNSVKLDTIDTKVNNLSIEIKTGGYFV